MDPAWDEAKRRLLLQHAMDFFAWRGTVRGLRAALALVIEDTPDASVFSDAPDLCVLRTRIVEMYQTKVTPGVVLGDPTEAVPAAPGGRWRPADGAADLDARYREALTAAGIAADQTTDFPITAPDDAADPDLARRLAVWTSVARTALGFLPSARDDDLPAWRAFLARRYPRFADLRAAYQLPARITTLDQVGWPDGLPDREPELTDWYQFQATVLPGRAAAHRFRVLLPVSAQIRAGADAAALAGPGRAGRAGPPGHRAGETGPHDLRREVLLGRVPGGGGAARPRHAHRPRRPLARLVRSRGARRSLPRPVRADRSRRGRLYAGSVPADLEPEVPMTTFTQAAPGQPRPDPAKHVNYTYGMVLGVDDFTQEFAYLAARDQSLAADLAGYGTICGLAVAYETTYDGPDRGPRISVSPGTAVTPSGQLICVDPAQCAYLVDWLASRRADVIAALGGTPGATPPASGSLDVYAVLCYAECLTDQVPVPGEPCRSEDELLAPSRIRDYFLLNLRLKPPDNPPPQDEEEAVRAFAAWLRQVPVTAGSTTTMPGIPRHTARRRGRRPVAAEPSLPADRPVLRHRAAGRVCGPGRAGGGFHAGGLPPVGDRTAALLAGRGRDLRVRPGRGDTGHGAARRP